jgi:hypothetical protein
MVGAGLLAGVLFTGGTYWDGSWHLEYGRDTFWSPPHLLIYGAILMMFVIAVLALRSLAQGRSGLAAGARRSPAVAFVAAASLVQLSAGPLDELWHRRFGLDITAWSPAHLMLIGGMAVTIIALIGVQVARTRMSNQASSWRWVGLSDAGLLGLAMLGITVLMVLLIEYELPGIPPWHPSQQRPEWTYPLLSAAIWVFGLVAALVTSRRYGAATVIALGYTAFRVLVPAILNAGNHPAPALPMPVIIPALALDVTMWLLMKRPARSLGTWQVLIAVVVFAAIHIALMAPVVEQVTGLPVLPQGAILRALPWAVIAAVVAAWAGLWLGKRLADWGEKSL